MISELFIDRPRLAIVIAIVISLAGLLALSRIPVAQLPDIVPPQVQVSAAYPGASAAVLEATVAQPITRTTATTAIKNPSLRIMSFPSPLLSVGRGRCRARARPSPASTAGPGSSRTSA